MPIRGYSCQWEKCQSWFTNWRLIGYTVFIHVFLQGYSYLATELAQPRTAGHLSSSPAGVQGEAATTRGYSSPSSLHAPELTPGCPAVLGVTVGIPMCQRCAARCGFETGASGKDARELPRKLMRLGKAIQIYLDGPRHNPSCN